MPAFCFGEIRRGEIDAGNDGHPSHVGLNHETVRGLIRLSGNPRLAWDCYRRFVQGYAEVVGGLEPRPFDELLQTFISAEEVTNEAELDPEALERLTSEFLGLVEERLGSAIPTDPMRQLEAAVRAVYRSWESPKACEYRRLNKLDDLLGTAVTVQAMVFGNAGGASGSGVAFTRNPATGAKVLYADFVPEGQGEDVVSGRRSPGELTMLRERMPRVAEELASGAALLEREFKTCRISNLRSRKVSCTSCRPVAASARRAPRSSSLSTF